MRRQLALAAALVTLMGSALAGCGTTASASKEPAITSAQAIPMVQLVQWAKNEGIVHGFGMPANWANLGGTWKSFQQKYGVKTLYVPEGQMSSAQEIEAFLKEKQHPIGDVGDIGISFGPIAVQDGALAAYKNQYWNQIPSNLKDPNGYWAAAYYGVTAFEVNTDKVKDIPHTWQDLLKPEYKGMIGIDDPRSAAVALDSVLAAAYAFGGSASNPEPGINFFADLRKNGNWAGATGDSSSVQSGQAAIAITWNYLGEADQSAFAGKPHIAVVVPSDGAVAGPYVEVVNKYAPHPYAARLLNTYLFSDAGQISYAEGGAYPVRLPYLKLPPSIQLPPLNMSKVHFLAGNLSQAQTAITQGWASQVLGQ